MAKRHPQTLGQLSIANGRSAIVPTVLFLKRLDELLEVELLVYLDEKVIGVDEVPETLGGELKQCGVSAVAV